MRYACLGAVGPDILYCLADYGGDLQDLESVLVKVGATFSCLGELMEQTNRYVTGAAGVISQQVVTDLMTQAKLVSGVISESLQALLTTGVNLWPVFEPAREKDRPRTAWYWADYLHYIRSGKFAATLLKHSKGDQFLRAYALGYLTHYVTDTVGHPYVNQVVGAPWRLAWQRHHLVENFIDAYVWDRWHAPVAAPPPPTVSEPPLDRLVTTPNAVGMGAPMTFARINDWVDIGDGGLGDPVDSIVDAICMQIQQGLFDIGIPADLGPAPPTGADFDKWTAFVAKSIRETYTGTVTPTNLMMNVIPGAPPNTRKDGFPTKEDVAAAYGVFRLIMKVTTEEQIKDPVAPNIVTDITTEVSAMMAAIAADLAGITPPPALPMGGSFSLSSLLSSLAAAAAWAGSVAAAVFAAANDFLMGVVNITNTVLSEPIRYALWLVNKALFGLYRAVRDQLVLEAYALPYTDEVNGMIGGLDLQTLWRSMGNTAPAPVVYPHEELVRMRTVFGAIYHPALPLTAPAELPALMTAAPYAATPGTGAASGTSS